MSALQTLVTDESYFKEGIKHVADKLEFKNYVTNIGIGVSDGVNYLGEIHRLNIEEFINGDSRKLYLIGKVIGKDEKKRKMLNLNKIATTECHVYNNVFPAFDSLQDKIGVAKKFSHPIAHLASAKNYEELILMEDLSKLDPPFSLPKNGKTLDYDHAKLILESLGHFHALSFALKQYNPEIFAELIKVTAKEELDDKTNSMMAQMVRNAYEAGIKKYPEAKNILDEFMDGICEKSNKLSDDTDERSVICHGDVWSYNLLYSYKNDIPIEVVLVDWQIIRHTSPVMDLLFCLFICVDEKTRDNHLHNFLRIYYDSLKRNLADLRCEANEIYSEDMFHSHIKKYLPSVIMHCIMMLPIFMTKKFAMDSFADTESDELIVPTINYSEKFYSRFGQMAKDIECLLNM